jgi:Zn-finger nucleic acid-binding protein
MLKCPNDGTPLASISIENVSVDQCSVCGGYWLLRGELETLGEHHGAHLASITIGPVEIVDSKRWCPQDGAQLCQHEFAEHTGIRIDQCPTCQGIWLEKTELSSILGYLDEGSHTEPTLTERAMLLLYQLTAHPPLM